MLGACDVGGPEPESDAPGLHVVSVDVTTRVVAEDGAVSFVQTPVAVDGSTRATVGTAIRVRVDRYLEPSSANRQALCVQSSTAVITSLDQCGAGLLLRPSYDPVTRTVSYYLDGDATRLAPETLYRVTLFRSEGADGFGLRAFDGPPLGGPFALEFTTEADPEDAPAPTDGPRLDVNFCSISKCKSACVARDDAETPGIDPAVTDCIEACQMGIEDVLGSCAYGGCHQSTGDEKAPMGLDLFAAEGLQQTAIAHVAHGSQRGPGASRADESDVSFGRSMAIIAPGDPGHSYLLYKIVANPAFSAADGTVARGETDRLRESVIVGAPMPPTFASVDGTSPAANGPLPLDMAALLSAWIGAGADTARCELPPP